MRSTPNALTVAAGIAGACVLLTSCEKQPPYAPYVPYEPPPRQPVVIAVSAPDSLAPGLPLHVVVHYFGQCQIGLPTTSVWSGDTLAITPWVKIQLDCGHDEGWNLWPYPFCDKALAKVGLPPQRTIPVKVFSAFNDLPRTTTVTAGVAPRARGFVQRFEVVRRDGAPVAGATITVTMNQSPWDTLGAAVTAGDGRAEIVIDSQGTSIDVNEYITTSGGGSEQWYQWLTLTRDQPLKTRILDRP